MTYLEVRLNHKNVPIVDFYEYRDRNIGNV